MKTVSAPSGGKKSRSSRARAAPPSALLPDGWLPIEPHLPGGKTSRKPTAGPDVLGLAVAVDPLRFLAHKSPPVDHRDGHQPRAHDATNSQLTRKSPRHRRLQVTAGEHRVAEAFSPLRSLRLTNVTAQPVLASTSLPIADRGDGQSNQLSMLSTAGQPYPPGTSELPLHELIQMVDDAVEADPRAELNQSAIARLFMEQWLRRFEADRRSFKSIAVRYQVGFQELQQLTANLPRPNDLLTTFCCKVLEDLTPHFGPYAPLVRVLGSEIHQSVYSRGGLPYFALVKHQKRLLLTLHKEKKRREERNDLLADDIGNVYSMFRHFLAECTNALVRSLLHEWYSIAIVRKKNSKKYIEHFSAWFGSSAKALVPKLFVAWKHEVTEQRMAKIDKQKQIDLQGLTVVKKQVDELTRQRDIAQVENLAMRNDRKQAEDWAARLERRIKAASTYLETTHRREAFVCQEGQLRVEAVACLPPLVLESLLRGYHGVGFLQYPSGSDSGVSGAATASNGDTETPAEQEEQSPANAAFLQDCFAEVMRLRYADERRVSCSAPARRSSTTMTRARAGRVNSVSVIPESSGAGEDPAAPPMEAAAAAGESGRGAGGAVSQDEFSGRTFSKLFRSAQQRMQGPGANAIFTPGYSLSLATTEHSDPSDGNGPVAVEYEQLLRAIRVQDEHYASHSKLFSSRMLESHEVSLVPTTPQHGESIQALGSLSATGSRDLGVINGAPRFLGATSSSSKPTTPTNATRETGAGARGGGGTGQPNQTQQTPVMLESLALLQRGDFDISPRHSRGFTVLLLAHLATEYGSLLFSPADMSAFTHNAYLHPPGERLESMEESQEVAAASPDAKKPRATGGRKRSSRFQTPPQTVNVAASVDAPAKTDDQAVTVRPVTTATSDDPLRSIQPLVTAYTTWNEISGQLIAAGVVQSRGLVPPAVLEAPSDAASGADLNKTSPTSQGPDATPAPGSPIRPLLLHQFEPLAHSSLLVPAREKTAHGRKASFSHSGEVTYHSAPVRHLSGEATARLIDSIEAMHSSVRVTASRLRDFHVTSRQVRELQLMQWEQASELAAQFESAPEKTAPLVVNSNIGDQRRHVFECISFSNNTMRRLFSVEDNPEEELFQARTVFQKHQKLIRRLYTQHRVNINHAVSLDDLWHIVKVLRLPREIHVLPILRDEELVANGYEQLFSPDDLAELFLQLCNEQFLPQITPLSARVEYFIANHLPLALQNQSLIRALMHRADVKLAISSHSQTIRIIFRRYCAKERELMVPTSGNTGKTRPRHTGHGITKYMRLIDWQAFIQDYHLLRARFSMEQATSVFRNVQEATTGSDDQLELIYSEFCEALVGVAMCYFPDPFLKTATKVTQFLRRYLPLSPDEAHDHA